MKLTDEQILALWSGSSVAVRPVLGSKKVLDFARAIESALTEKQEPVAWGIVASNTGRICQVELDADEAAEHNQKYVVPLYTHPAPVNQRTTELEAELMEQARVNGMGSEREAALMARVERLEQALDVALEALETNLWSVANLAPHEDVEAYTAAINLLKELRRD